MKGDQTGAAASRRPVGADPTTTGPAARGFAARLLTVVLLATSLPAALAADADRREPTAESDRRTGAAAGPARDQVATRASTRRRDLVAFRLLQVQSVDRENLDAPRRRLRNTRVNPFDPESLRRFFRGP